MTAKTAPKLDSTGAEAADLARDAVVGLVGAAEVGDHLGCVADGDRVVTHYFACLQAGYLGWRWAVTVARAARQKSVTVDEIVLLPGEDAIVAPTWVPWRERVQPGDLSPGDILPTDEDDPRLAAAYTSADETVDRDAVKSVSEELGLGRPRVLSQEGRESAAERWYDGEQGPNVPLAQSAPGICAGCGFFVRLSGPLSQLFGVCANAFANDDGRVVSLDHGCGAHSEAKLNKRPRVQALPDPVLDTLTWDDLDIF